MDTLTQRASKACPFSGDLWTWRLNSLVSFKMSCVIHMPRLARERVEAPPVEEQWVWQERWCCHSKCGTFFAHLNHFHPYPLVVEFWGFAPLKHGTLSDILLTDPGGEQRDSGH